MTDYFEHNIIIIPLNYEALVITQHCLKYHYLSFISTYTGTFLKFIIDHLISIEVFLYLLWCNFLSEVDCYLVILY